MLLTISASSFLHQKIISYEQNSIRIMARTGMDSGS